MKRAFICYVNVFLLGIVAVVSAGCSSTSLNRAPVEDRATRVAPAPVSVTEVPAVKQAPGFENAGKVGYYTVKPGDTLLKIALEHGQSFRDLASWNQLDNPNKIEVGQVLRVIAPLPSNVEIKPVPKPVVATAPVDQPAPAPASASVAAVAPAAPAASVATTNWIWPVNGSVIAGFDDAKNKGIDLGGKAGDPVLAVADGRVVYVGAGLRGYGNLIILKHDNVFLTAYAHNRTLLVKEDQSVIKGQKIAEMGDSDADRVKLHFEVRRQGKPVDPLQHLPAR